ncbi:MAG: TatD family hydrolase [Bacteroidales bacterium]|nr:TatD family hydrolase [Bacteroidales bacterium]
MQLIDTHSHLYLDDFQNDISAIIRRAQEQGISQIILPNIDAASVAHLLKLAEDYPGICIPLPGLHPTHVRENYLEELDTIYGLMDVNKYKAIGEIGIDLYWDKTFYREQVSAFEYQLTLALRHDLPVVIHARDSFHEILQVVRKAEFTGLQGVFHAFTGDSEQAREIVERGFFLGVGGIITFKNSHLPEVISRVPLERLVLETDSPFLAPVPHRGKRNESSYVIHVAQRLAELKNVSIEQVAQQTTENACKLFSL